MVVLDCDCKSLLEVVTVFPSLVLVALACVALSLTVTVVVATTGITTAASTGTLLRYIRLGGSKPFPLVGGEIARRVRYVNAVNLDSTIASASAPTSTVTSTAGHPFRKTPAAPEPTAPTTLVTLVHSTNVSSSHG